METLEKFEMPKTKKTAKWARKRLASEVVEITPEVAREMLENNDNIRDFKIKVAEKYATLMEEGKWDEKNGQTINFREDGTLMNGQHRLAAIAISGKTMRFVVTMGGDSDRNIDNGKNRSPSVYLADAGSKYASRTIIALRLIMAHQDGTSYASASMGSSVGKTNDDICSTFSKNRQVDNWVGKAMRLEKTVPGLIAAHLGFVLYMLDKAGRLQVAERILDQLSGVQAAPVGSPIYSLKARFAENNAKVAEKRQVRLAILVKAANAMMAGSKSFSLRYRDGMDDFPTLNV